MLLPVVVRLICWLLRAACCICCVYYFRHVYICCCLLLSLVHPVVWVLALLLVTTRPRSLPAAGAAAAATSCCWLGAGLPLTPCQLLQLLRLHQAAEQGIQPLDSQLMPTPDMVILQDVLQQHLTQAVTWG
jgi:hypothetical protein